MIFSKSPGVKMERRARYDKQRTADLDISRTKIDVLRRYGKACPCLFTTFASMGLSKSRANLVRYDLKFGSMPIMLRQIAPIPEKLLIRAILNAALFYLWSTTLLQLAQDYQIKCLMLREDNENSNVTNRCL